MVTLRGDQPPIVESQLVTAAQQLADHVTALRNAGRNEQADQVAAKLAAEYPSSSNRGVLSQGLIGNAAPCTAGYEVRFWDVSSGWVNSGNEGCVSGAGSLDLSTLPLACAQCDINTACETNCTVMCMGTTGCDPIYALCNCVGNWQGNVRSYDVPGSTGSTGSWECGQYGLATIPISCPDSEVEIPSTSDCSSHGDPWTLNLDGQCGV